MDSTGYRPAMDSFSLAGRTVGRLGFGAMRLVDLSPADAIALLRRVVGLGVTLLDTADIYGDGASEELIAAALHPYPTDLLVATKGGFIPGRIAPGERMLPCDASPARLRTVCEASLTRLRLDRIDLYQLHVPDPKVPFEDSVGALCDLRDEGKIGAIGLSNIGRRHLRSARALTSVASVQNRYNLLDRSSEAVLRECETAGIAFLPWAPVHGIGHEVVVDMARRRNVTPNEICLAWLLQRSAVMAPIPGTSKIAHLETNVSAVDLILAPDEVSELDACVVEAP
jgi:pyridoxine 4-dehydrogenase